MEPRPLCGAPVPVTPTSRSLLTLWGGRTEQGRMCFSLSAFLRPDNGPGGERGTGGREGGGRERLLQLSVAATAGY